MIHKIVPVVLILCSIAISQNLQLHYEASSDREYLVSTLEMFKPDKYGSTFWFVDMEYDAPEVKGVSLVYWEIARSFATPINNLSATVQYNDGVANFGSLGQAWMVGVNYYFDLGFVALPLDILYRSFQGAKSADFQLTTTWFIPLMDGNVEFSGFIDLWTEDEAGDGSDGKRLVLQTEPQVWYNANEHLAIGTEVEISSGFVRDENGDIVDGIKALPTLGLRWNF
ncbi:DUF5020 family protein [bacterium]|nr:DUF5020 family protein [bacterium]